MRNIRKIILAVLLLAACVVDAQAREVYNINRGWKFFAAAEKDSTVVNLPHSWNFRGEGNYLRYVDIKPLGRETRVFVKFHGANSVTDLLVNGCHVGQHCGGDNAFVFEITGYVESGRNLLWVVVNNSPRTDVLPTAGEEMAYGGLYRDVELILTGGAAIGFDAYGSDGAFVKPSSVSADMAEGKVAVSINSNVSRQVQLALTIRDDKGGIVWESSARAKAENGMTSTSVPYKIKSPVLWQGVENPYLYTFSVVMNDGVKRDSVGFHYGVRTISMDGHRFLLNGKPYPVRGVTMRRDRAVYGRVAHPEQIADDLATVREMGANTVRVVGGAHSNAFYDECDRLGLLVVQESAFTGAPVMERKGFYNSKTFRTNARQGQHETVWQQYNHPSIAVWCIFSNPELRGDDPIPFICELNGEVKAADPSRLTAGASNKDGDINDITDLIIWNHTFGWGEGKPGDIRIWQRQIEADRVWGRLHSAVAFRCGGSPFSQSPKLERPLVEGSFHPEQWQTLFHEIYLSALANESFFWGLFAGEMFDFAAPRYEGGALPGVADYGLVTFDRNIRKDAFYLYKANWNDSEQFVYITEKRYKVRSESLQTIKVFSNMADPVLFVNGVSQGTTKGSFGVFEWEVELQKGANVLLAVAEGVMDECTVIVAPNAVL